MVDYLVVCTDRPFAGVLWQASLMSESACGQAALGSMVASLMPGSVGTALVLK